MYVLLSAGIIELLVGSEGTFGPFNRIPTFNRINNVFPVDIATRASTAASFTDQIVPVLSLLGLILG